LQTALKYINAAKSSFTCRQISVLWANTKVCIQIQEKTKFVLTSLRQLYLSAGKLCTYIKTSKQRAMNNVTLLYDKLKVPLLASI
jgi:hypothetical protein